MDWDELERKAFRNKVAREIRQQKQSEQMTESLAHEVLRDCRAMVRDLEQGATEIREAIRLGVMKSDDGEIEIARINAEIESVKRLINVLVEKGADNG